MQRTAKTNTHNKKTNTTTRGKPTQRTLKRTLRTKSLNTPHSQRPPTLSFYSTTQTNKKAIKSSKLSNTLISPTTTTLTSPFHSTPKSLDQLYASNVISTRLKAEFPHPAEIPDSQRFPATMGRFKLEKRNWSTNPNCKATSPPSFTNWLYSDAFKTAKQLTNTGKAREFEAWMAIEGNKKKIDLNAQDYYGSTFLCTAAKKHLYGVVCTLLKHGALPDYPSSSGPALFHAISTLDMPIIRKLIEYGADVNYVSPTTKQNPLMIACSVENSAYPLLLLENGANEGINAVDTNGRTALMYAALRSTANVCSILIERGADIQMKDINGLNAIDYALKRNVAKVDVEGNEKKNAVLELLRGVLKEQEKQGLDKL